MGHAVVQEEFEKGDVDGSGQIDFDEFAQYYNTLKDYLKADAPSSTPPLSPHPSLPSSPPLHQPSPSPPICTSYLEHPIPSPPPFSLLLLPPLFPPRSLPGDDLIV